MNRCSTVLRCLGTVGGASGSWTSTPHATSQSTTSINVRPLFPSPGQSLDVDASVSVRWPPDDAELGANSNTNNASDTVTAASTSSPLPHRRPRSPFAVLRGQPFVTGRCTAALRSQTPPRAENPPTGDLANLASSVRLPELCACAALVYPSRSAHISAEEAEMQAARDQFMMALKLSPSSEVRLRACVSEAELNALLSDPNSGQSSLAMTATTTKDMLAARLVMLCDEIAVPSPLRTNPDVVAETAWSARLLLPAEEGSRVRWLHEESADFTGSYHRAPSLRSLAVMVSIQRGRAQTSSDSSRPPYPIRRGEHDRSYTPVAASGAGSEGASTTPGGASALHASPEGTHLHGPNKTPSVTLDDVLQVEKRMEDRGEPWTMVDLASLALVAGDDPDVAAHLLRRCAEMLMPTAPPATDTASSFASHASAADGSGAGKGAASVLGQPHASGGYAMNGTATPHREAASTVSASVQLQRDLGQIIAALVLWQQAMYFLDVVMPPAIREGDRIAALDTKPSARAKNALGRSPSSTPPSSSSPPVTRIASPSAILRERHGLEFHFPVAELLDASSNLLRLHRAYLQSAAAQSASGGGGRGAGRGGTGSWRNADDGDNAAHSLWRSASETARGLFTFGADGEEVREAGAGANSWSSQLGGKRGDNGAAGDGVPQVPSLPLSQDATLRSVLFKVLDRLYKDVHRLAEETFGVIDNEAYLSAVTGWLLMEAPESLVCARHFRRLVDSDPTAALKALERSGLLGRHSPGARLNLNSVVSRLLPLLQHCENEDFYNSAIRELLAVLEDQLRHDPTAFTNDDMKELAIIGTQVFAVSPSEANHSTTFDASVRGQMEELHVMDGSPWALVVSSYTALKEMMAGLHKDHQKLKQQVQDQMRSMGLMSASNEDESIRAAEGGSPTTTGAPATTAPSTPAGAMSTATTEAAPRATVAGPTAPLRLTVSPTLRHRFLVFLEDLVKDLVDDNRGVDVERPIVISSELFDFINRQVPVPNIQDEYRRKIFLLVNVAEDPETTRQRELARRKEEEAEAEEARRTRRHTSLLTRLMERRAERQKESAKKGPKDGDDAHGGVDEIPAELRFLVSSLPLTLSPWACVMILREVLAESAGKNPRYSYVLNAAIDLQLPISTTRSRIATTLNMWRFLNSQTHKLTLKENVLVKQRCVWNLPLSYILSSYWSLLTSFIVAFLVMLNVVGIDFESQLVANTLFQQFAPFEEIDCTEAGAWQREAATDLASDYLEQGELARKKREQRSSTDVILSSASYLFLGYDDQRRPFTLVPISSDASRVNSLEAADSRHAEEYAGAVSVLRELSLHVPFPFYMDFERPLPLELLEARVADRIRRISFNNTWFGPRMIIRTFPLGRQYTEHSLIAHTCAQANLTRRRITFLFYIQDGVPVTETFLKRLMQSQLAQSANLVLVVHERSLQSGGVSVTDAERLMDLPPLPPPPPQSQRQGMAHSTAETAAPRAPMPLRSSASSASEQPERDASTNTTTRTDANTASDSNASHDTAADAASRHAEARMPMRVLPFSRQLYDQGLYVDAIAAAGSPAVVSQAGSQVHLKSSVSGPRQGRRRGRVMEGLPGDSHLSPFACRFKAARRSLWTTGDANRGAELDKSGADRGSHGVLSAVWEGLVRPTAQLALLPVTMVVRAVGNNAGGSSTEDAEGQSSKEAVPRHGDPTVEPGDGTDAPTPPMHGLVSVPSEIFMSTVQGTKHLVASTRDGLWPRPSRTPDGPGEATEPLSSPAPQAAPAKRSWLPHWRRAPPVWPVDTTTDPNAAAVVASPESRDGLPPAPGTKDTTTSARTDAEQDEQSAGELPSAMAPHGISAERLVAVRRAVEDRAMAVWHGYTAPPSLHTTEQFLSLAQRQEADRLDALISKALLSFRADHAAPSP